MRLEGEDVGGIKGDSVEDMLVLVLVHVHVHGIMSSS